MIIAKNMILTSIFILFGFSRVSFADNDLVLQLKHVSPELRLKIMQEYKTEKQEAGVPELNIEKENIKKLLTPKLSNIACIYGGYTKTASRNGLVTFPLRHTGDAVHVAITPSIKLHHFSQNTIDDCSFDADAKLYLLTRKSSEPSEKPQAENQKPTDQEPAKADSPTEIKKTSESAYWEIQEIPVKKGDLVPRNTIIILTEIDNIFVELKAFMATKTAQLILPFAFHVVGDIKAEECLLRALDYKAFFERIATETKYDPEKQRKQQRITNL